MSKSITKAMEQVSEEIDALSDEYIEVEEQMLALASKRKYIRGEIKSLERYYRLLIRSTYDE